MKSYKKYVGPRQVARKRRRKLCIMVVALIAVLMALTAAPAPAREQAVKPTSKPSWARPTKSNIAYARNCYGLNGDNGEALVYLERWEEFAEYIVGEKDIDELTELPDGTVMP